MSDMSSSNKVLFGNPEEDRSKIFVMDQAEQLNEEIDDVVSIEEGKKRRKKKSSAQSLI